jgi:hypothetical protein
MCVLPTQDNDVFWRKIKHLSRGTGQALVVMAVMSGGGHPLGVPAPGHSPARTPYAFHAEQLVTLAPYFNPGGPSLAILPSASEELPEEYLQLIASFNNWQQKLYPSQPPDALDDPGLVAHLYRMSGGHVSLLHRTGQCCVCKRRIADIGGSGVGTYVVRTTASMPSMEDPALSPCEWCIISCAGGNDHSPAGHGVSKAEETAVGAGQVQQGCQVRHLACCREALATL